RRAVLAAPPLAARPAHEPGAGLDRARAERPGAPTRPAGGRVRRGPPLLRAHPTVRATRGRAARAGHAPGGRQPLGRPTDAGLARGAKGARALVTRDRPPRYGAGGPDRRDFATAHRPGHPLAR